MRIDGEGCVLCFVVFLHYNSRQNENDMLWMMHMIKMIVYEGDGSQKRKQIGLTSVALSKFWPDLKYTCISGSLFLLFEQMFIIIYCQTNPSAPLKIVEMIIFCVSFEIALDFMMGTSSVASSIEWILRIELNWKCAQWWHTHGRIILNNFILEIFEWKKETEILHFIEVADCRSHKECSVVVIFSQWIFSWHFCQTKQQSIGPHISYLLLTK